MGIGTAIFFPVFGRLVACLADTLTGGSWVNITSGLGGSVQSVGIKKFDISFSRSCLSRILPLNFRPDELAID